MKKYLLILFFLFPLAFALTCPASITQCCYMNNASSYTVVSSFTNSTAPACLVFNNTNQNLVFKHDVVITGGAANAIGISTAQSVAENSSVLTPNADVRNFTRALYANKTTLWINRKNYACYTGISSCLQFDSGTGSGIANASVAANGTAIFFNTLTSGYISNVTASSNSTCLFIGTGATNAVITQTFCTSAGSAGGGAMFITGSSGVSISHSSATTSGTQIPCFISASGSGTYTNLTCVQSGSVSALKISGAGATNNTMQGIIANNTGTGAGCDVQILNAGTFNGSTCQSAASAGFGTPLIGFSNVTFANGTITGGSATLGAVQMRLISQNNTVYGNYICQNAGRNAVQLLAGNVRWNIFYNNTFCNVSGAMVNYTAGLINYFNGTVNGSCKGNWYGWMNESVDAFDTDGDEQADTGTQYIFNSTSVPDRFIGANVSDFCPSPGRHYAPQNITFTNPSANSQNITAFQPYLINWTFNLWGATTFAGCNLTLDGTNYSGTQISATQCQYSLSSYGNHTIQAWISASDWFGTKSNSTEVWNFTLTEPPSPQNCSWITPAANNSNTYNATFPFEWSCDTSGQNITACWLNASNTIVNGTYHPKLGLPNASANGFGEPCTSNSTCLSGYCNSNGSCGNTVCAPLCDSTDSMSVCTGTESGCSSQDLINCNSPEPPFNDCSATGYTLCTDTCGPACINDGGICNPTNDQCCNSNCNAATRTCGGTSLPLPSNWNLSWCNATWGPEPQYHNQDVWIQGFMQNNWSAQNSTPRWNFSFAFNGWYVPYSHGLRPTPVINRTSTAYCELVTVWDTNQTNITTTLFFVNGTQIAQNTTQNAPTNQLIPTLSQDFTNFTAGDQVYVLCNYSASGTWAFSAPQRIRPMRYTETVSDESIWMVGFALIGFAILFTYLHVTAQNAVWRQVWLACLFLTGMVEFGSLMVSAQELGGAVLADASLAFLAIFTGFFALIVSLLGLYALTNALKGVQNALQ